MVKVIPIQKRKPFDVPVISPKLTAMEWIRSNPKIPLNPLDLTALRVYIAKHQLTALRDPTIPLPMSVQP